MDGKLSPMHALGGLAAYCTRKSIPVRWFSAPLSSELLKKFSAQMNTAWEALALLVALRLWLPKLPKHISTRIKSDNVGALRMLLKMTSPSGPLSTIAREIALDVAADNYQIAELEGSCTELRLELLEDVVEKEERAFWARE